MTCNIDAEKWEFRAKQLSALLAATFQAFAKFSSQKLIADRALTKDVVELGQEITGYANEWTTLTKQWAEESEAGSGLG